MPSLSAFSVAAMLLLGAAPAPVMTVQQVIIRQRIVIRVPVIEQPVPAAATEVSETATPIEWSEHKMAKCVPIKSLIGAAAVEDDQVDLIANGIGRIRAHLGDDCPGLGYYHGFYMKGTSDGMICADRDSLRTRAGNQCEITAFRKLTPKKHRRFRFP